MNLPVIKFCSYGHSPLISRTRRIWANKVCPSYDSSHCTPNKRIAWGIKYFYKLSSQFSSALAVEANLSSVFYITLLLLVIQTLVFCAVIDQIKAYYHRYFFKLSVFYFVFHSLLANVSLSFFRTPFSFILGHVKKKNISPSCTNSQVFAYQYSCLRQNLVHFSPKE